MNDPSSWQEQRFQFALRVVEKASHLSRAVQAQAVEAHAKSDASPVTVADLAVQALVSLSLAKEFPEDQLIGEESADQLKAEPALLEQVSSHLDWSPEEILGSFEERTHSPDAFRWILDPIDGTKGFLRGDQFAVALAGQEPDSSLLFGCLGCPRLGLSGNGHGDGAIGGAYRGRGAWQRSLADPEWSQISKSGVQDAHGIRLLRSFEASHTNESQIEEFVARNGIKADPVRLDSQAKYLLLARGDAEGVVRCLSPKRPNYKEKIWDQAAGVILISEAGCQISDLLGNPLDFSTGRQLTNNTGVVAHNGAFKKLDWKPLQP